jgi:putative ABC transport system permease protein
VDPNLPIGRVATMAQLLSDSVSEPRFRTVLLGGFAASALALIAVGMLGVLGHFVARRTSEIGVRVALGARRADVVGLVVKQALTMASVGIGLGAMLSLALTGLLSRFLFEISPRDPAAFIGAAAVLGALGIVATYVPARRATRIDPLIALRAE